MSKSTAPAQISRRKFLGSQAAMAAIATTPLLESAAHAFGAEPVGEALPDYYDKLGVTKFINAAGTYTALTSATMPPVVRAAVEQAAKHPVHLLELQTKCGEYLASRLKCEGALVSCGASSALTLATAACVQAANQCSFMDIPQAIGSSKFPKNEVIMQKAHRYGYDHAMYLCGIKIVEVVTLDDYKKALNPDTVMTNYLNAADGGEIGEEEWLTVAHQHNVPCHLDAAADMPPISNLWKYTGMGFDLVCFSGGKAIRGPQNAGLLLGKKKLIDLAAQSNNPGDGVGRGMKVAKEQLVGMVAAVDWLLSQTDESMEQDARRKAAVITDMLKGIPSVETSIFVPAFANHFPQLCISFDPKIVGIDIREARQRLLTGSPAIELNPHTGSTRASQGVPAQPNSLVVITSFMADGEERQVGEQISKLLKDPKSVGHLPPGGMPDPFLRRGAGA